MKTDIAHGLKKYLKPLLEAQQQKLNEADTVQRIVMVFQDVLGYDPLTEISHELEVKSKYVDLAIKIEGTIKFFVEAKGAGKKLRQRHFAQGELYAAEGNIHWVLVTNGVEWSLYHVAITTGKGLKFDSVFSVTLAEETLDESAEKLALLHRNSVKAGELEKSWEHQTALSTATIGRAIFTEDVLRHIRKEIHQQQEILIDIEELASKIQDLLTTEAKGLIGPTKIRYHKQAAKQTKTQPSDTGDSAATSEPILPPSVSPSSDPPSASP